MLLDARRKKFTEGQLVLVKLPVGAEFVARVASIEESSLVQNPNQPPLAVLTLSVDPQVVTLPSGVMITEFYILDDPTPPVDGNRIAMPMKTNMKM